MNSEVGNSLIKIIIKKQGWGDGGADGVVVVGCYRVRSRDCGQPSFELSGVTPHRGPPIEATVWCGWTRGWAQPCSLVRGIWSCHVTTKQSLNPVLRSVKCGCL